MKIFSIASLERFSDIKAHTFRIWEHRYNFLIPNRTETNFRYYTIDDLNKLLNISLLNKYGYKISQLDKMLPQDIEKKIAELTGDDERKTKKINRLIITMFSADTEEFENILDNSVLHWGIDVTIEEIILPFLDRVKLLSYNDQSSETHFTVTAIRRKIILGIEKANPIKRINKSILFFLPEDEHFDLVLLYMNYVAKREGYKSLYLGTNISMETLQNAAIEKSPDLLFTYLVPKHDLDIDGLAQHLEQNLPNSILMLSGVTGKLLSTSIPANVRLVNHRQIKQLLLELSCKKILVHG